MNDKKTSEPRIAAALVNGLRRQLLDADRWRELEALIDARDPSLADWLAESERAEWVSLDGHLRFMQILLDHIGEDALASFGADRMRGDLELGPLSPILRSWVREYGRDPSALMRVAPHAWQAATRNAGRMVVVSTEAKGIRFRVEGAPPELLRMRAWHVLLRGFGAELLRLSGAQGSFSVEPVDGSLALEASWA